MQWIKKFPIIRIFIRWLEYITRQAPLNDFENYDEYWAFRKEQGLTTRELDRFKIIASKLNGTETILDIGCGDCSFQSYLKKVKPECKTLGLDFSEQAVEFGTSLGHCVQHINENERLQTKIDTTWEVITLMEIIEHVSDAEDLIKQVITLNPKKIFITIPNVGCSRHRLRLMFGGRFPITSIYYHMKEHVRFWTVKDFLQWADYLNLEVVSVSGQFDQGDKYVEFMARKFPSLCADRVVYELIIRK